MINKTYERLRDSGQMTERQCEVWMVLLRHGDQEGMTAREIRAWCKNDWHHDHSGVHSRLRELEAIDVVELVDRVRCPLSHRLVNAWRLK